MKLQTFIALITPMIYYTGNVNSQEACEEGSERETAQYIQICHNGMWKYLCADSDNLTQWREVRFVVCTQLGYEYKKQDNNEAVLAKTRCPSETTDSIIIQSSGCSDKIVQDCATLADIPTCTECVTSSCNIGVIGAGCGTERLRLIGETEGGLEGRVEVCVHNRWGTVCDNNNEIINTVCSSLHSSHPFGVVITYNPPFSQRSSHNCQSFNSSMNNCSEAECSDLLAVRCLDIQSILENKMYCLVTQTGQWRRTPSGQVQVCEQGLWITRISGTEQGDNSTPAIEEITRETMSDSGQLTVTLGAIIGLLFIVLLFTVLGWCISCVLFRRKLNPNNECSPKTNPNQSYTLKELSKDDGGYSSLGPNYTPDEGQYDVVDHKQQQQGHYNVLDRSGGASVAVMESCDPSDGQYDTVDQKPGPPPTKTQDPQPNKEEEFYNAEDHTYSVVVKNKNKKKTQPQ